MAHGIYKHKYKEKYSVRRFYVTKTFFFISWNKHTHTEKIPMGVCAHCGKEEHEHKEDPTRYSRGFDIAY